MPRAKLALVTTPYGSDTYKRAMAAQAGPRRYRVDYAGGSRSGYCKTLESATHWAMAHLLFDGYASANVVNIRTGEDIVRLRMNDTRTKVIVNTVKKWKK
jgi:hypothetical protein